MSDARWAYTCHAGFDFPQTVCKRLILKRKWWNWQTHHLEGVAPKGVGVQIPPSAPTHSFYLRQEGRPGRLGWLSHVLFDRPDLRGSHSGELLPDYCRAPAERQERRHRGGVRR